MTEVLEGLTECMGLLEAAACAKHAEAACSDLLTLGLWGRQPIIISSSFSSPQDCAIASSYLCQSAWTVCLFPMDHMSSQACP